MEDDDEIKGEGNSYDFGARMYDPRVGRWFKRDPLERKYPDFSTYSFGFNNPILFIDPDGNEPIKPKVTGLKALIRKMDKLGVNSLFEFYQEYSNDFTVATAENGVGGKRYMYSTRWGWVDLKHFSSAAFGTDTPQYTGNMVLKKGEDIEKAQARATGTERGSAYAYEDLPSNILGVYFEEWLENDDTTKEEFAVLAKELGIAVDKKVPGKNRTTSNRFLLQLYKYAKELGFVDNPEDFEDYKKLSNQENDTSSSRGLKNYGYTPHPETTTEPLKSEGIDKKIKDRAKKYKNRKSKKKNSNG